MATERRYYDDGYTTRFAGARHRASASTPAGPAVELARDLVLSRERRPARRPRHASAARACSTCRPTTTARVWHVVDAPPAAAGSPCEIDWARRFDHMQQHTGQHILSAAFERVLQTPRRCPRRWARRGASSRSRSPDDRLAHRGRGRGGREPRAVGGPRDRAALDRRRGRQALPAAQAAHGRTGASASSRSRTGTVRRAAARTRGARARWA